MKIVDEKIIVNRGVSPKVAEKIRGDIETGIQRVCWPVGSDAFSLDPNSAGKKRNQGNGVKPIKVEFINYLKASGWLPEFKLSKLKGIGPLDAVLKTPDGYFAAEWETGNISSSHRALNKICLQVMKGELIGGALILPSNKLYKFLTDRIGNFREIKPYIPLFQSMPYKKGLIFIVVIEYDNLIEGTPRIPKATDGFAQVLPTQSR